MAETRFSEYPSIRIKIWLKYQDTALEGEHRLKNIYQIFFSMKKFTSLLFLLYNT